MTTLAWRPFLDPLPLDAWWFVLLIPMALGVAMAYKAVRVHDLSTYWKAVLGMTLQIILGIAGLGLGIYIFVQFIATRLLT
ncbi:MAG: hypothetical protein SFY96_09680 [Planctomycetota bacterium]|nr:hypothetical protein [Planctomycetota bacterium]